jgi:tyrosyl-tRNA synthetase
MKECGLVPSGSEARRKIQEGAVEIDDRRVTDIKETLTVKDSATIIRVGKKQFARVVPRK